MLTIKMANDLGVYAETNPDLTITQGQHGKHFFEMTETEPVCVIADSFGSTNIDYNASGITAFYTVRSNSDEPGNAVRMMYWANGVNTFLARGVDSAWTPSLGKDMIMFICAKVIHAPVSDSITPLPDSCTTPIGNGNNWTENDQIEWGGAFSFYMGEAHNAINGQVKIQPYYAVFGHDAITAGTTDGQLQTPFYEPMKSRVDGEVYFSCAIKRGNVLEHYVCDSSGAVFTGSADITTKPAAMQTAWNAGVYGDFFRSGHGAVGTPGDFTGSFDPIEGNDRAIVEWQNDVYGIGVSHFVQSAPPENIIRLGMEWMRREFIKGNKKIYPGWMMYI